MVNKQSKFACKWGREQGYNKGWHATNCAGALRELEYALVELNLFWNVGKIVIVLKIPKYIILKLKILITTVSSLNATRHEKVQSRERF